MGTLAYDWKNKISNTGLLRFCSKQVHTAQEERTEESSVSQSKGLEFEGAELLHTAASAEDNKVQRTETDLSHGTQARDSHTFAEESKSSSPLSAIEEAKLSSSGSATKRTSNSAGLTPKKRHASASLKNKFSTPKNQRMISDFFKK